MNGGSSSTLKTRLEEFIQRALEKVKSGSPSGPSPSTGLITDYRLIETELLSSLLRESARSPSSSLEALGQSRTITALPLVLPESIALEAESAFLVMDVEGALNGDGPGVWDTFDTLRKEAKNVNFGLLYGGSLPAYAKSDAEWTNKLYDAYRKKKKVPTLNVLHGRASGRSMFAQQMIQDHVRMGRTVQFLDTEMTIDLLKPRTK